MLLPHSRQIGEPSWCHSCVTDAQVEVGRREVKLRDTISLKVLEHETSQLEEFTNKPS